MFDKLYPIFGNIKNLASEKKSKDYRCMVYIFGLFCMNAPMFMEILKISNIYLWYNCVILKAEFYM